MTHLLPPNLLRFFVPPPPLPGLPTTSDEINPLAPPNTVRRSKGRKEIPPLTGVASFLERVKQEAADKGEATEEGDTGFESQLKKAANPTSTSTSKRGLNGKVKKEEDPEAMDQDEGEEGEQEDQGEGQSANQKFTYAEQTKRELRRELKKKQHEERRERGLKECECKGNGKIGCQTTRICNIDWMHAWSRRVLINVKCSIYFGWLSRASEDCTQLGSGRKALLTDARISPSLLLLTLSFSFFWSFNWTDNPKKDPEAVGDPFKTLFLGRLVRIRIPQSQA